MKYITISTRETLPFAVLFSPHVAHADIAKLFAPALPVSAGFVTLGRDGRAHTTGFSTSLGVGPAKIDADLIAAGMEQTARQYPAPPV